MFGRLLGKVAALPIRIANLPFTVIDKVVADDGIDFTPLGGLADAVEESVAEALGDDDGRR